MGLISKFNLKTLFLLIFFTLKVFSALEDQKPYLPNNNLDVKSYDLKLKLENINTGLIKADLKITALSKVFTNKIQLHFDSSRINMHSISFHEKPVEYSITKGLEGGYHLSQDILNVFLPYKLVPQVGFQLHLSYDIKIKEIDPKSNSMEQEGFFHTNSTLGSNIVQTHNWPYYARTWLPSNDHPSDGALFRVIATVPSSYKVFSNGELVNLDYQNGSQKSEGDFKVYEWIQNKPIPTYSMFVAIGDFNFIKWDIPTNEDINSNTKKIHSVFFYPSNTPDEKLSEFKAEFNLASDSVTWFSKILFSYEFKKLGVIFAPDSPYPMENASTITLPDSQAIGHEISHHWWGNSVRINHWGDYWISEGFATYTNRLFKEAHNDDISSFCKEFDMNDILNQPPETDPMIISDQTARCKGVSALQDLRMSIAQLLKIENDTTKNRELMIIVLKDLYIKFRGKTLETKQFISYLNKNLNSILQRNGYKDVSLRKTNELISQWKAKWFN